MLIEAHAVKVDASLLLVAVSDTQSVKALAEPKLLNFGVYLCAPKPDPTMDRVAPMKARTLQGFEFDRLMRSNDAKPETLPIFRPHDRETQVVFPIPGPAFKARTESEIHAVCCLPVQPRRPPKLNQRKPKETPTKEKTKEEGEENRFANKTPEIEEKS